MISALHERWVALLEIALRSRFPSRLQSSGTRTQELSSVLALYAWHSRHHTAHITNLRKRMCW